MSIFITFEGIEGAGKTTQIERLKSYLETLSHTVVTTKEPGGTPMGRQIRSFLLAPSTHLNHMMTETLLFIADRVEHISSVIQPALLNGKIVICDRYIDSTMAYQVGGKQVPENEVLVLMKLIQLMPQLTILLDIMPDEGIRRAKQRAGLDRFEQEQMDFHYRVRDQYLLQAQRYPNRIVVIDVMDKTVDDVFENIINVLPKILKEN